MNIEVNRRRWRFLGHVLRIPREHHCVTALTWAPMGKRKVGRPKTTWRSTVEKERTMAGWKSWRKWAPWLRIGTSGRWVARPYAQQSAKWIGEVRIEGLYLIWTYRGGSDICLSTMNIRSCQECLCSHSKAKHCPPDVVRHIRKKGKCLVDI